MLTGAAWPYLEPTREQAGMQGLQLGVVQEGFQIGAGEGVSEGGHVLQVGVLGQGQRGTERLQDLQA